MMEFKTKQRILQMKSKARANMFDLDSASTGSSKTNG